MSLRDDPAAHGLRALGTNAAVYLGTTFARRHNSVNEIYLRAWQKVPRILKQVLPMPPAMSHSDPVIFSALEALGNEGTPATPMVMATVRNADWFTAEMALQWLGKVRQDPAQADSLLEHWSARGQHELVVKAVPLLCVGSRAAATSLARAASKGKRETRQNALFQLEKIGPDGAVVVQEVATYLHDPDENVRYAAARALAAFAVESPPAKFFLMQATNDESSMVRNAANRALANVQ